VLSIVAHFLATPLVVLSDPPATFRLLFAGTGLGTAGAIASAGVAGYCWTSGRWGPFERIQYALVAVSLLAGCWLLWYWNLLLPPGAV
jgi:hypothetical protein